MRFYIQISMVVLMIFCGMTAASNGAFAAVERFLGNVVAIERNFGAPKFDQCKDVFKSYLSEINFGCSVRLIQAPAHEELIKFNSFSTSDDLCRVELISTTYGYVVQVSKRSYAIPTLTQTEALNCVKSAFASEGWEKKELVSTLFTVR